jgi:pimeloyl-ACP methyl ester carboxylesterase
MVYVKVEPHVKVFIQVEGEGKPIVLLHGWGLNHDMWKYQVPYLKERGYKVVAVDLRGFGKSSKPATSYSYDTWANDVEKVIEGLDLQDVTLVGYSLGGAIAMHYTSTRDELRVTKLALVAAAGPRMTWDWDNPWGKPREFWDGLIDVIRRDPPQVAYQQFFAKTFLPVSPTASEWPYQWLYDIGASASQQALIGGLEEMRDRNLTQALSNIRISTRILHGIWDILVPYAFAKKQRNLIVGAIQRPFLWSGHGLFFEEGRKLSHEIVW